MEDFSNVKLSDKSLRRKAISPLIATLILIAITVVGGVVVYRAFFATSGSVSSNLHVAIQDYSISASAGLSLTIKNDGTTAIDLDNGGESIVVTGPGTPGCDAWDPSALGTLAPGSVLAIHLVCSTDTDLLIPGNTYILTLTVFGPGVVGSVVTTASAIALA